MRKFGGKVTRYPFIYFVFFFTINSRGQAKDGIAYGPLTDLPDWSYAGININFKKKAL